MVGTPQQQLPVLVPRKQSQRRSLRLAGPLVCWLRWQQLASRHGLQGFRWQREARGGRGGCAEQLLAREGRGAQGQGSG